MLKFLESHQQPVPSWLRRMTVKDVHRGPDKWMKRFLDEAIVYPGSGTDGSPIRQMQGIAHAFLFLDLFVGLEQIKQTLMVEGKELFGPSRPQLVAMAEFNPVPFLAAGDLQAPGPRDELQRDSYGIWAILDHPEGGGRFAFMALGTEGMNALSALYPSTPPKGIVLQEHSFDSNPWGEWERPITSFAEEHWELPPEWLILGRDRSWFSHRAGHYEPLGEDQAFESMHRSWRVIHKFHRE